MKPYCSGSACSQGLTQAHLSAGPGAPMPWQRVLFHRIRGEYAALDARRDATRTAEQGLGMQPSAYWYIGRVEPDYASMVSLSQVCVSGIGSVAPFDTGGLWHGRMRTINDPLSPAQKKSLYSSSVLAVSAFDLPMSGWLDGAYPTTPVDYCRGVTPTHHFVSEVIIDDQATPRDWSWELAVAIAADMSDFPKLISLHMTPSVLDAYERWVMASPDISRLDALDHLEVLENVVSRTLQPYADASAQCERIWSEARDAVKGAQ